jgi:hypothetical protein
MAIDRKPEAGCEIQNTACGRSGIMLQLKLVKTAESESAHAEVDANTGLLHGTEVLKFLLMPWVRTGRIVCADSYVASVPAAAELKRLGLHFIEVVKTASRMFPQDYLARLKIFNRGEQEGVYCKAEGSDDPLFMAFVWVDRN